MKIINIDTEQTKPIFDEKSFEFKTVKRKPTFNLIVEMTQKEYQLVAYLLAKYQNELATIIPNKKIIDELIKESEKTNEKIYKNKRRKCL